MVCFIVIMLTEIMVLCVLKKKKKITKIQLLAVVAESIFVALIFGTTVFTRAPGERKYELQLFWSWMRIFQTGDRELLKENVLNILMFVPVGCMLPLIMQEKYRWWKALLFGAGFSFFIELCQLVLCRGLFEWDDVVHNALGCLIGTRMVSEGLKKILRVPDTIKRKEKKE